MEQTEVVPESKELPKVEMSELQKIKQEFDNHTYFIGNFQYQIRNLEEKIIFSEKKQDELGKRYEKALEKEKKEKQDDKG